MDIELSEFDVDTFAVVSGPSDLDIAKAKNLDGENWSLSKTRSRKAFDSIEPVVKIASGMDKCPRVCALAQVKNLLDATTFSL